MTPTLDDEDATEVIPCGDELQSGVVKNWSLPSASGPQLLFGTDGVCIDAPENSTSLTIEFEGNPDTAQFGLFVTANRDAFGTGEFEPDNALTGNDLSLTIGPESNPPFETGQYFITGISLAENTEMSGTLIVTVNGPGGGMSRPGAARRTRAHPRRCPLRHLRVRRSPET